MPISPSPDEKLVEVDASRLAVRTSGQGGPPVVLLSALGCDFEHWVQLAQLVEPVTTVFWYGRPGIGGSDELGPDAAARLRGARWSATQLRDLLDRSGLAKPFVLLSASIGAFIADQFATMWPELVGGMVLVDPTNISKFPDPIDRDDVMVDSEPGGTKFSKRLIDEEMTAAVPRVSAVVLSSAIGRWERLDPAPWQPFTLAEVDKIWRARQLEWVQRLGADHVIADMAGHHVHRDQPALAVHVVEAMTRAVRAGQPLRLDADTVAAAGGRLAEAEDENLAGG